LVEGVAKGKPLKAVMCLLVPPTLALCSASKMRELEYDVYGGLNCKPLEVFKAETVDLLVLAFASRTELRKSSEIARKHSSSTRMPLT
jgi:3-polyprenyl-4-hydroxybenzoate decarboxylase